MATLACHAKRLNTVVPPPEYVWKYVDQGPFNGGHWFWKDGRSNHGHNKRGQAYVRWKVKPCAESGWQTHGEFTVVRLLLEQQKPIPKGLRIACVCGLSQCVNPAHWQRTTPLVSWRFETRPDGVWQLVRTNTGEASDRTVVVHVMLDNVVHLVPIAPLAQRAFGSPRSICGVSLDPQFSFVTRAALTCTGCR